MDLERKMRRMKVKMIGGGEKNSKKSYEIFTTPALSGNQNANREQVAGKDRHNKIQALSLQKY